jgi:predicted ribosomally synthesized peptide with SipW-like signal peptide
MLIWAAAASFGAMAGIAVALAWFNSDENADLPVDESISWILSAIVVAVLFVAVLGPGITL